MSGRAGSLERLAARLADLERRVEALESRFGLRRTRRANRPRASRSGILAAIREKTAAGMTARGACAEHGISFSTFRRWQRQESAKRVHDENF